MKQAKKQMDYRNKRVPLSIGVKKIPKRSTQGVYFVRKIHGIGKNMIQMTSYDPARKSLLVAIGQKDAPEPISAVWCEIKGLNAEIQTARTKPEYQGNLLATQIITEAVHTLEKMGIETITADVITPHDSVYKMLGFEKIGLSGDSDGIIYIKKIKRK